MEFFKKHTDALVVIGSIVCAMAWIHTEFTALNRDMNMRFSAVEKDIAVMKTCMLLKNIMPPDLAQCKKEEK